MGMAGRETVVRRFSVEQVANQTVELYRELLIKTGIRTPTAGLA
jgi:hypothetical protein